MKQRTLAVACSLTTLTLLMGCAGNGTTVPTESSVTTVKTDTASPSAPLAATTRVVTNAIVALVNDEVITLHGVIREAEASLTEAAKKGTVTPELRTQLRKAALERLIEKKMVEQKIKELNIKVSDEEVRLAIEDVRRQNKIPSQEAFVAALASQGLTFDTYRSQLQEQLEKLKLVSIEVRSKVQVGESEMRSYYEANVAKYSEEESYRARHIFFKSGATASAAERERAKTTALSVLADARGGKDFVELAKSFSEDPAARKDGGDLGSFKKGDMLPELEKTILALQPGQLSEPVTTPIGIHIIKLEAIQPGTRKPFETVKGEIEDILYRKKSEDRFSLWAKELRSKATIEIKTWEGLP